jgi:hypothetical protein
MKLLEGKKTVTTAGTAVQLAASATAKSVVVQALLTNTGNICVGGTAVKASTPTAPLLEAGQTISVDIDDIGAVWIDSTVNGEGVAFLSGANL